MHIPPSLLSAIITASGRSLAERIAADAAKLLLASEVATHALRDAVETAVDALDVRDLAREEIGRVVERDVDVDRAFEDAKDDIERDLRREAESIDLEELAKDVVAEAMQDDEIEKGLKRAMVAAVDDQRDAVVQAAGAALAAAVIESAQGDAPAGVTTTAFPS